MIAPRFVALVVCVAMAVACAGAVRVHQSEPEPGIALPLPLANVAGFAQSSVHWGPFLSQHDLVWTWSSDPASWPSSWETAAWVGNGLHGLSPMVDPASGGLRFEVARADVYSCGYDPRLPIGYLLLTTVGTVLSGNMTQALYTAEVSGVVATTAGEVRFSAFTAATQPVSVVQWSASHGEAGARLTFVSEPASARSTTMHPQWVNPAPVCSGSPLDRLQLCTQPLACDPTRRSNYTTAVYTPASTTPGAGITTAFISVGNHQPTAAQLPAPAVDDSMHEAYRNVLHAAETGMVSLRQAHTQWWASYFETQSSGSFVSIGGPGGGRRVEGFYHIQQAKIGGYLRADGTPISDQQGPFKADLTMVDERDNTTNGSGWEGLWFDWNVEENYWGVARSNRVPLVNSLRRGLRAGRANMAANALQFRNATHGLALTCGLGLNLLGAPASKASGSLVTDPPQIVWRGVAFAAHVVWRTCMSLPAASDGGRQECITEDLEPLLSGVYWTYTTALFANTSSANSSTLHLNTTNDAAGTPLEIDNSASLAALRWSCLTLLDVTASSRRRHSPTAASPPNSSSSSSSRGDHRAAMDPIEAAVHGCAALLPRLAEPGLDASGALLASSGSPFSPNAPGSSGIEFAYQVFPMAVWNRYTHPSVVDATADALMRHNCSQYGFCNDLYYTMKTGLNAAAGRGDAALGNLTEFLDTDRHRLGRDGTAFAPGCSRPCGHCQPCVAPNTMVEEGTNPILEGGPALAANVQQMFLQDFTVPMPMPVPEAPVLTRTDAMALRARYTVTNGHANADTNTNPNTNTNTNGHTDVNASTNAYINANADINANANTANSDDYAHVSTSTSTVLMSIFPAVPNEWSEVVFYRFRALGAVLVSARLSEGILQWVQLETDIADNTVIKPFLIDAPFARGVLRDPGTGSHDGVPLPVRVHVRSTTGNITATPVPGHGGQLLVRGLGGLGGSTALLFREGHEPTTSSLSVVPLAGNDSLNNYYGFRPQLV